MDQAWVGTEKTRCATSRRLSWGATLSRWQRRHCPESGTRALHHRRTHCAGHVASKSELTGRDMYEKMVQLKPQFLLFLASNDPPALVNDLANRERTNVVEHVSVFHNHPVEANHAQWKDIEATLDRGQRQSTSPC